MQPVQRCPGASRENKRGTGWEVRGVWSGTLSLESTLSPALPVLSLSTLQLMEWGLNQIICLVPFDILEHCEFPTNPWAGATRP